MRIAADPSLTLEQGDYHARVENDALILPQKLFDHANGLARPPNDHQSLCEWLVCAPAHFVVGLGWRPHDLMRANERLFALLMENGKPFSPPPEPTPRSFGANPPARKV